MTRKQAAPDARDALLELVMSDKDTEIGSVNALEVRGHIEILVREQLITVGPFPGSIFLFYAAEELANAVARLREGYVRFEVPLVGDPASLWFTTPRTRPSEEVSIAYRASRSAFIRREQLDLACGEGIEDFLTRLSEQIPMSKWDSETRDIVEVTASVWPSIASLQRPSG